MPICTSMSAETTLSQAIDKADKRDASVGRGWKSGSNTSSQVDLEQISRQGSSSVR